MRKKIMNGIAAIVAAALLLTAALPASAADDPADGQSPIEIYTPVRPAKMCQSETQV